MDDVVTALAQADAAHIAAAVTAAQSDDSVLAIVVLTHTVPHRDLLLKGVYPKLLLDSAFYGNSLMEHIPALDTQHKLALWVFGHSHAGADATRGHVRYVSHPRGRPDDFGRKSFAPLLIELTAQPGTPPAVRVLRDGDDDAAPAES